MQYGIETSFKSRLQQYFIENQKSSLRIRLFNVFIKLLSCVLYCVRVVNDSKKLPSFVKSVRHNEGEIKYEYLFWVDRNDYLWLAQTVVAFISIFETIIIFYISYQGNLFRLLINAHFLLELVTSFPFAITIFQPSLRRLYVPVFLNCWLAKGSLQAMMNDLNRGSFMNQSALFRQLLLLFSIMLCLIFTGMCSIEHLQRAGDRQFDLFTSFYFVMVTFSTVGYGDWYPDTWMSRLCVVILICVAIVLLPSQVEALGQTWIERQKSGGDYGGRWSKNEKHVVVTITHLEVEFIRDFLDEFYAHNENKAKLDNQTRLLLKIALYHERVHYIRGSALRDEDLERSSFMNVGVAKYWAWIYEKLAASVVMQRDPRFEDANKLSFIVWLDPFFGRARLGSAHACFILSARHQNKKIITDEHTILRSWAVKDFAPHVKQYVQIFKPETKMHIEHAEVLICEDEFKYSLLANNCICPGISTFITLLMHTSRGEEGKKSTEPWHKVYGFHSGNEIYMIKAEDSKFFGHFIGKSFTYASFHAHRNYGIGLIGVKSDEENAKTLLNPGKAYVIQSTDILYYMGLTNEESLYDFRKDIKNQQKKANLASTIANIGAVAIDVPDFEESVKKISKYRRRGLLQKSKGMDEVKLIDVPVDNSRRPSIEIVTEKARDSSTDSDHEETCAKCRGQCIQKKIQRTYPQVRTYIGTSNTVCHMLKEKRPICCLQLDKACAHCSYTSAYEYNWTNKPIILAADKTSSGMYNLIIPLRAYYRPIHELHPIVLLLELEETASPNPAFLDAISYFPGIFWMQGKISVLDNLLRAGVSRAEHVIVVKETASLAEEHFADCSTIITVQKIHRMFPRLRMITELTHASNMRFVQFNANSPYSLAQSRFEKKERKRGSHMPFMFRLPFAQGGVFSANMLDRLLYQAIIKPYVVALTRLLLGIDQTAGSGYLTSITLTSDDLWIQTYGRLYQKLCSSVADIPIGIFRTKYMDSKTVSHEMEEKYRTMDVADISKERKKDMYNHVKSRMRDMGISMDEELLDNGEDIDRSNTISFVIINPAADLQLEAGDIVYVLRSPVKQDAKGNKINPRRGLRRACNVQEITVDDVNKDAGQASATQLSLMESR
ncbi:hypothetical protein KIN20_008663 [Parelaphostrongylus tenuis]|uniref:Uncharacterized protein n=1 Tax=Parelaphostrongylus tenuis TaxID=148309 RepID=A0AAD5QKR1_PARTN|nr:hypothetical protein KIN20_008663 [Parelaphostrongylus tenuis]